MVLIFNHNMVGELETTLESPLGDALVENVARLLPRVLLELSERLVAVAFFMESQSSCNGTIYLRTSSVNQLQR